MPPAKPLIYAELLSNIRQISILAFLDTPSDSATKAELLADGTLLKLYHAKQHIELKLPGQVVSNSELREFPLGSLELSWRLPLAGEFQRADVDIAQTVEAPWSAKDLVVGEQAFGCRKCAATIVEADRIKEWRDLPSEGWAEMMDFWHCHKPSDHANYSHENENQTNLASTKGYGANTKFTAQAGIGFVDHSSFLLAEGDCNLPSGENESPSSSDYGFLDRLEDSKPWHYARRIFLETLDVTGLAQIKRTIRCENGLCLAEIGYSDPHNEGIRLFKWSLRMETLENSSLSELSDADFEPSMASILSAQFSAIMNASCVSRLVLLPTPVTSKYGPVYPGLSIWVFNASIRFTSAYFYRTRKTHVSRSNKPGILAMKILWKQCAPTRDPSADNGSVEELELPGGMLHGFEHYLEEISERYLPPSARKLQDWNVSLLERYEAKAKVT
ncbi:hypothetical protein DSL72_005751 [Monilinia vaccinii-corymbosi]|uniref:Ubiquitin-conjugating enzyme E2-binding protein n=1 Tax=Monilinia vaccinii-corymbosi TaxID=61207 RepID=A0A8A3PGI5_9HELO|nr:hypothetical protein DSL72_005751 [Monilinia vaccinii-corymbosi]